MVMDNDVVATETSCRKAVTTCPDCMQPTRFMRCGLSQGHEGPHIFPTGYGHQPPFGKGRCPNITDFTPQELNWLFDDYEGEQRSKNLYNDNNEIDAWIKVFNPPQLTAEFVSAHGLCGVSCTTCRVQMDPRYSDLMKLIWKEALAQSVHPFGYTMATMEQIVERRRKE